MINASRRFGPVFAITLCLTAATLPLYGQSRRGLDCNDGWRGNRGYQHCEMREQALAAVRGTLSVDGELNGGISVKGWNQNSILVRARVQATAPTQSESIALAGQIRIETTGNRIRAVGPAQEREWSWAVSYEIFVPSRTDLSLKTHNGGIGVEDVQGRIEFNALNGGVALKRLAGHVTGSTTNGGLSIDLSGSRWQGEGLDVRTTNGGVNLSIPENYSAHLETGTVNGSFNIGFPVTVQGRLDKNLSVTLGSGGPPVRARTTNGGVRIERKS